MASVNMNQPLLALAGYTIRFTTPDGAGPERATKRGQTACCNSCSGCRSALRD